MLALTREIQRVVTSAAISDGDVGAVLLAR